MRRSSHSQSPPPPALDDSGLRRRHSAPLDDDDSLEEFQRRRRQSNSAADFQQHRRVATDPLLGSFEPQTELQRAGSRKSTAAGEGAGRVRFSSDIQRILPGDNGRSEPRSSSNNKSTAGVLRKPSVTIGPKPPSERPGTPNLSINTGPSSTMDSDPNAHSSQPSATSPQSAISRLSARNRGYSLRRSLFFRNMNDGGTSPIELQESGSSQDRPAVEQSTSIRRKGSQKSRDFTTVTITPTNDSADYEDNPRKPGFQGISALPHYEAWLRDKTSKHIPIQKAKAVFEKARKFVLRIHEIPPSKDGRHIDLDAARKTNLLDERTSKAYINNFIRSTRYNIWNFIPRQLLAQFSKLANFYFLCVSILQMIPGLSTTGTYTTIVPVLFFVSISIGREGYDDLRRYRLDKEENNRKASVLHAYQPVEGQSQATKENPGTPSLGPKHWSSTKWQDVRVGDIIKLERDQAVPADVVLLHSKGENGIAYIETMALDGETNLKSKEAPANLRDRCDTVDRLAAADAHFVVEDPNLDLYNFEGKVTVGSETVPLTNSEVIYRGSILRNTPEAVGIVIYSGEECKIRMNASKNPRIKAPALQAVVNRIIILIMAFVVLLSVFNTVAYQIWGHNFEDKAWYLTYADVGTGQIIVSFIIMFNTMIPISLYVSLEIVKVVQMLLLNDIDMYHEESDTPLEARTSTINEELGQVSYVFSDKTGTLTDNSMKFRKLSVAGTAWLHDSDLKDEAAKKEKYRHLMHKKRSKGKKPARPSGVSFASDDARRQSSGFNSTPLVESQPDAALQDQVPRRWTSSARPRKPQPEMETSTMLEYIRRRPYTVFAKKARFFLLTIALCHTCLPETKEDGSINFQSASPDELALVQAAQEMGYIVIDRQSGVVTLKLDSTGQQERYEVLDVIEFSSKRKRMSVVIRLPDGRICVVSKGADSVIMERLRRSRLAFQKTAEIEKRSSLRKSVEAEQALVRRQSELESRKSSLGAASPIVSRKSFGTIGRSSLSANPMQPIRDQVSNWLTQREHDVDASGNGVDAEHYSPRPSGHFGRTSMAPSEARSSFQDDVNFELVEESLATNEEKIFERCFQHINDFATEGLRTLLYGYRFVDVDEYQAWKKVYHDATTSLVNRQELIEDAGEQIERDFELAGATAIEDKLQHGVPEAIDKLRRANIKMWMLTGDKRETAINIGHSCRLIKDYSSVTVLDHESGHVEQNIAAAVYEINNGGIAHAVVVVDGQTLSMIEEDQHLTNLFFDLSVVADSVICCRASPSQKASLVSSIRRKVKGSITLAIGDGANDIAMIQEAHVGIGITGKEGLQAARTSDYSIAQFRFLTKLLLVHGRWNYIRTCKYTLATFWKEMFFYLTQALFQRWAGYTGTSLYESWSLSMFNTLFTSLPVIFIGIFEKDLAASTLLAVPELYTKGQRSGGFNFKLYLWWMFLASSEAVIAYFSMFTLFAPSSGFLGVGDLFPLGDLTFTAIVTFVSIKMLFLEMHNRSIANGIAAFASVGGWFLWNILLSIIYAQNQIYKVKGGFLAKFGADLAWWITLLFIIIAILVFEVTFKALKSGLKPSDTDVFQALEKDLPTRKRFEEAAAAELQQGWQARGQGKKSSVEVAEEEAKAVREQNQREEEVAELLRLRSREENEPVVTVRPPTAPAPRQSDTLLDTSDGLEDTISRLNEYDTARARRSVDVTKTRASLSPTFGSPRSLIAPTFGSLHFGQSTASSRPAQPVDTNMGLGIESTQETKASSPPKRSKSLGSLLQKDRPDLLD